MASHHITLREKKGTVILTGETGELRIVTDRSSELSGPGITDFSHPAKKLWLEIEGAFVADGVTTRRSLSFDMTDASAAAAYAGAELVRDFKDRQVKTGPDAEIFAEVFSGSPRLALGLRLNNGKPRLFAEVVCKLGKARIEADAPKSYDDLAGLLVKLGQLLPNSFDS